jgi:hypothetical protein
MTCKDPDGLCWIAVTSVWILGPSGRDHTYSEEGLGGTVGPRGSAPAVHTVIPSPAQQARSHKYPEALWLSGLSNHNFRAQHPIPAHYWKQFLSLTPPGRR